ncbi:MULTISPECIES: Rrf2 family transcriptional regulator [unclassified Brevundimonas]|uniref:Rrf2 family transcriptional regulator n=1 Tax=unclassified Brevundimonas TaxID=2622653 RepID=UPI000CFE3033|nr:MULTISPECIES: Rrf2 family transcriptional regulator [unclassified Brevundimonas]PRA23746.1 Rrf2 family transcriptional regulator [Brevundimonas sp. MYb27]PQZ74682.1 Rrf2 family transcriptional regulator [Brevundimonas sp. MYb31]PRB12174.1 Rrf2 family transcriptional regulator [Brevundimonas sp. MYb52]PRB33077.1 Rrf2 family transcriptional regulator [Brevundimonas sp. MYb46]PRB41378.1 Rrf2 family transcriptional regulator [Brevundimonas sp. MYb33]
MSDSQKFPVAAHALAYLAHKGAYSAADAAPSAILAASVPTNPVVIRRVTALLAKAGLIATRPGASGGSWLLRQPETIRLDEVLKAVNGCAHLGSTPAGAKGCPVGEHIPRQVAKALTAADRAAGEALAKITIADLLEADPASLRDFAPHSSCPVAA